MGTYHLILLPAAYAQAWTFGIIDPIVNEDSPRCLNMGTLGSYPVDRLSAIFYAKVDHIDLAKTVDKLQP